MFGYNGYCRRRPTGRSYPQAGSTSERVQCRVPSTEVDFASSLLAHRSSLGHRWAMPTNSVVIDDKSHMYRIAGKVRRDVYRRLILTGFIIILVEKLGGWSICARVVPLCLTLKLALTGSSGQPYTALRCSFLLWQCSGEIDAACRGCKIFHASSGGVAHFTLCLDDDDSVMTIAWYVCASSICVEAS